MDLLVGDYLSDYLICEHLGQGGFADVYRCIHKRSQKEYAIKVLQKASGQNEKNLFLNEVELHLQMDHRSIVKIADADTQKNFFLVMDYVPLGNLCRLSGQQVELAIVIPYIKQVAEALDYIHKKQIVHCDIKPDNFLLKADNTILLCDFGIAIRMARPLSSVYGTLEYVSPEQLQQKPCPASDQYSLAIVVYEWLSGEYPFNNRADILKQPPPSLRQKLPALPQEIEDSVFKALMKQPQERYPTISAFATALEQASQGTQQGAASMRPASLASSPAAVLKRTRVVGKPIIVAPAPSHGTRLIYKTAIGREESSLYIYRSHQAEVTALAWSPGGNRLVSADINNAIHTWDALNGSNVTIHKGVAHMILNMLWSPDGACIAVADELQAVQFWDVKTGKRIFRYQHRVGKPGEVGIGFYYPMAWSKQGQFMISASNDQPLEKWDTTTGNCLLTYKGHTRGVKAIAWSPDESTVASGGADTTIHVWNATNGNTEFKYNGHRKGRDIRALAWSPSSQRIASADSGGQIHVWNAIDGENLLIYDKHLPYTTNAMVWSPDGTKIASAGRDKSVRVWDALTGQTLVVYEEHTESINILNWSPDGQYLASASKDGTVRIWQIDV